MNELIDRVPDFSYSDPEQTVPSSIVLASLGAAAIEKFETDLQPKLLESSDVIGAAHRMSESLSVSEDSADKNTGELLQYYQPTKGIEIGSHTFYLTDVVATEGGRKHAVAYTELDDGTVAPRLFYKSNSDGFWRATPEYEINDTPEKPSRYYSKGDTMAYGYARETRLNADLEMVLERGEQAATVNLEPGQLEWMLQHFQGSRLGKTNTYEDEAYEIRLKGFEDFFAFQPGRGFETTDGRPAREIISEMKVAPARMPDFTTEPRRSTTQVHALLGEVQVDVYGSQDGLLEWNMAHTPDGKVWVNGLTKSNSDSPEVTSYGTDAEVVSAGVIDSKPLEYASQVQGLEPSRDYKPTPYGSYVELTVLDNLAPIRQFRHDRGIYRQAA